MNKSYVILQLYDKFKEGKKVKINESCGEYDISVSTFRRYVAFLRGYFNEFYGQEIIYSSHTCQYFLENK